MCILTELITRVQYKEAAQAEFNNLYSVMSLLSCVGPTYLSLTVQLHDQGAARPPVRHRATRLSLNFPAAPTSSTASPVSATCVR